MFIKNKLLYGKNDFYTGVLLVLFSVFLYINSLNLDNVVALYPRAMLFIIGAIGVIFIVRPIKNIEKSKKETKKVSPDHSVIKMSVSIIALLLFWILVPILGFYVAIFFYIAFTMLFIGRKFSYGEFLNSFMYSTFFVIVLYLIFNMFLRIQTPSGILL